MKFGSVCSGIEAASVAWEPLGWRAAWFAEIDKFPSAVLKYRYPQVENYGDFTQIGSDAPAIDVLVGGTPCQDFSIAGLRAGVAGERGNLTLEFLKLAGRLRPRWLVWENVPGVLSIDGGRTFGAFLGGLGQLGYGFAYRVLDSQYFGVPQRRRRVFVVGYLGDWRCAAAVLFERFSLSGHPAPSRKAGKDVAPTLEQRAGRSGANNFATSGGLVAPTISARTKGDGGLGTDFDLDGGLICPTLRAGGNRTGGDRPPGTDVDTCESLIAMRLNAKGGSGRIDGESETFIAHALRGEGFDASEDGTGRGTPLVAFSCKDHGADAGDISPTLRSMGHNSSHANAGGQVAVAFAQNTRNEVREMPYAGALAAEPGMKQQTYLRLGMGVRRFTPRECERLQGFPDDWTLVPYRGKPAADGPRYKAIGNSMTVTVMQWIGGRIGKVDGLLKFPLRGNNSHASMEHARDERSDVP